MKMRGYLFLLIYTEALEDTLIQELSDQPTQLYQDEGEIATAEKTRRPLV